MGNPDKNQKNPGMAEYTKAAAESPTQEGENQIRVDGFAQVLAMLKIADPEFRESLLRRLATRDIELARSLRAQIANS